MLDKLLAEFRELAMLLLSANDRGCLLPLVVSLASWPDFVFNTLKLSYEFAREFFGLDKEIGGYFLDITTARAVLGGVGEK